MAQVKKSENTSKAMEEKYKEIVELTNGFSKENLNEEHAQHNKICSCCIM